ARIVLDVHDPMPELYGSKFGLGPHHPVIRAVQWQEHASLRFADHVICTHELFRERLVELGVGRERISVVLNVADPSIFGPIGALSDRLDRAPLPTIVYHGTIAERLGLDVALDAFTRLWQSNSDLRLRIIGTGDFAPTLRALIDKSPAAQAVDFPDRHLPVEQLPDAIGDAAVGLVPNRSDPSTRLMLPVKLLEYAHVGIPAVAPRLPAITQYFDETRCGLYQAGDAASLAAALNTMLNDSKRAADVRSKALAWSGEFAWDRMRHALFEAIDGGDHG
ncbi:MAG: glycosyltransferase, partial [Myxococcota bacterium]